MPLEGKQIIPREVVNLVAPHWPNSKVKATATVLGESAGYVGAYHDNQDSSGNITSRDCGFFQINIPESEVGTSIEDSLRTDSLDANVYTEVLKTNVNRAYALYEQPWERNNQTDIRRWQPWVAYTSGWAMFPSWWTWHQDALGNPIGPWVATGRYLHRAIEGVANYHLLITKDMNPSEATKEANRLATFYGIAPDNCYYFSQSHNLVLYKVPPKPTLPPADGVGPRPLVNDGF